jgi:integrase
MVRRASTLPRQRPAGQEREDAAGIQLPPRLLPRLHGQNNLRYLDQIDRKQLLRYVKFLREHDNDVDDRTVHNIFETLNTFLRTRDILIAGKILAELDYAEKPPKPYTKQELKDMFAAMHDEEKLLYGLFLNSGVRDAEMQNTEYADFNWEKCRLHVQPKAWRKFRLKGKSKKKIR